MTHLLERIKAELCPPADAFDKEFGVKTAGLSSLLFRRVLSGRMSECSRYQPIQPENFSAAIRDVPRWKFIDLGCGKGRALILAHNAGFNDLVGVEFSSKLVRAAKKNLSHLGIDAEILHLDASKYNLPDEPCVVFLYNPFGWDIMQRVVSKTMYAEHPRLFIYVNPVHDSVFYGSGYSIIESGETHRTFGNEQVLLNCNQ